MQTFFFGLLFFNGVHCKLLLLKSFKNQGRSNSRGSVSENLTKVTCIGNMKTIMQIKLKNNPKIIRRLNKWSS